jgi:transcriptional regulator with XRE-family HTH domain
MYEVFEHLLKMHNVTVADVCRATGISHSTMSNWKKRKNNLNTKNARLVADYFGVTVEYLATGIEPTKELTSREERLLAYFRRLNLGRRFYPILFTTYILY